MILKSMALESIAALKRIGATFSTQLYEGSLPSSRLERPSKHNRGSFLDDVYKHNSKQRSPFKQDWDPSNTHHQESCPPLARIGFSTKIMASACRLGGPPKHSSRKGTWGLQGNIRGPGTYCGTVGVLGVRGWQWGEGVFSSCAHAGATPRPLLATALGQRWEQRVRRPIQKHGIRGVDDDSSACTVAR